MNKLLISLLILFLASSIIYSYPEGWSDDILLTPEDDRSRGHADVDVDQYNNVWVVWDSGVPMVGTGEVLYTKRDSLGSCLIPETNVSNHPAVCVAPRIAIDPSNNAQIIWRGASPSGGGVWHAKLANDGSFIVPSHIAIDGFGACDYMPQMELNKYNEICIIWDEPAVRYPQMTFSKLDSLGNPLIERISVSLPGVCTCYPGIGIDSMANVHTGFRSDSGIADRLTYTKLDKNGKIIISNKFFGTGLLPTIIADHSQNIHIVYGDPTGPGNSIKYLKLDQEANILVGPITLSIYENNNHPHMAMDSLQYLHVVWHLEDPQGIMYTKLDTLGNFVISPIIVVYPPDAVWPAQPRIAVDYSNRLHLVWKDQRLGSEDIFYKRGENENMVEETAQLKAPNLPKISVFPNPFSKLIKISFGKAQGAKSTGLKIYDATGRVVR
ncbi:hypothetical protein KAX97_13100, partial [candidate division WOR-3 bacterium]|nr:hypothetical protein [candidate division WOR-3 bacterium]